MSKVPTIEELADVTGATEEQLKVEAKAAAGIQDVLIRTTREDIEHKARENITNPDTTECYWTVNGTPRQTGRGASILFSDGDRVIARSRIRRVEDGRIWFDPVEFVDAPQTKTPPTRGFTYVR
ncbi:hypothetical protein HLRTI_001336 [Halorhabdus tiamatea SARL4B]|uniref:Uncharacterized protein n=1 Tax=Halorhabdus tiamatea SARL4B TaxID=1033806 RepID=F7PI35_9EURY|nr:hypothetical protein [Halorhabdus tiamatea]ERJ06630.1 hypothetical protein HLRTI_001336 [Halorhabdus tiamatea SARL4B]CCQ32218.1 hypothetical protein HTIA_0067 [Halorhabdus tiamatea SARL4B]